MMLSLVIINALFLPGLALKSGRGLSYLVVDFSMVDFLETLLHFS